MVDSWNSNQDEQIWTLIWSYLSWYLGCEIRTTLHTASAMEMLRGMCISAMSELQGLQGSLDHPAQLQGSSWTDGLKASLDAGWQDVGFRTPVMRSVLSMRFCDCWHCEVIIYIYIIYKYLFISSHICIKRVCVCVYIYMQIYIYIHMHTYIIIYTHYVHVIYLLMYRQMHTNAWLFHIHIAYTHTYICIDYIYIVVDLHAFFLGEELAADRPAHENEGSTWIVPGR
jgi:hypothetical protein